MEKQNAYVYKVLQLCRKLIPLMLFDQACFSFMTFVSKQDKKKEKLSLS